MAPQLGYSTKMLLGDARFGPKADRVAARFLTF